MRLSPEFIADALDCWPVARLSTLGEAGHPAPVPIVFLARPGELWSAIDGKPKSSQGAEGLARVVNLVRDPRVGVLVDAYEADWRCLWWIQLQGEAEVVRCERPEGDEQLGPVVAGLRLKYPQYAVTPLFAGVPTLLRIRVLETRSWVADEALARATLTAASSPRPASPALSGDGSG